MSTEPGGRTGRRDFLIRGGAAVAAALTARTVLFAQAPAAQPPIPATEAHPEVSTVEDLMREHGLLARLLLIYDESRRRLQAGANPPAAVVPDAANIINTFVQDYHEKLEEDFIFPRFEKAGVLTDLVHTLLAQHQAGRRVTDLILASPAATDPDARRALSENLSRFTTMYRPHKAREDTVLFPAFHDLVTVKEYDQLGDQFESRETSLFGQNGFEKMVQRVAGIEQQLGLYELARFTPKV